MRIRSEPIRPDPIPIRSESIPLGSSRESGRVGWVQIRIGSGSSRFGVGSDRGRAGPGYCSCSTSLSGGIHGDRFRMVGSDRGAIDPKKICNLWVCLSECMEPVKVIGKVFEKLKLSVANHVDAATKHVWVFVFLCAFDEICQKNKNVQKTYTFFKEVHVGTMLAKTVKNKRLAVLIGSSHKTKVQKRRRKQKSKRCIV